MVSVDDLRYHYHKGGQQRPALDGLSFRVRAGEIFGLLGPNGAGKTTAVKLMTTILRPASGRIELNGIDVAARPLEARRQIAAVLQENAVETLLSVRDNLLLYARLHGRSRSEATRLASRAAEMLDLDDQIDKRAQSLSGGYKRRLQVAKALMIETPVLFLDEATTGMDPLIKRRAMAAIREQSERGRTVLLTTQLLDEAEELCDHMVLMNHGRALAAGKLSELKALSKKMFRITLGFAAPSDDAKHALKALGPKQYQESDGEIEMAVEGAEDSWLREIAKISERWPVSHFEIRGANLEQIFFDLYGEEERNQ